MANEKLIEFGNSIRRWRLELGYNQEELGKLAGVSKQYISNIERAEPSSYTGEPTQPSIEVVDKLAKALRHPIQEVRDLAGYGIERDGAMNQEHDEETERKAEIARTAEMIQNWGEMSPEEQAAALAFLKFLKAEHPDGLKVLGPGFKFKTTDQIDTSQPHVKEEKKQ